MAENVFLRFKRGPLEMTKGKKAGKKKNKKLTVTATCLLMRRLNFALNKSTT
jgi:hypothetical protein